MQPIVRAFEERDQEAVIALSPRAWAPVFASLEEVLDETGVYSQMHPDWRVDQKRPYALRWFKDSGMALAETGGSPGHAPTATHNAHGQDTVRTSGGG